MAAGFKTRNGVLIRYSGQEKTIEIPEGVQEIRENAFRDFRYPESVHLPAGLKKIAVDAFRWCYALTDITVDKDNETYDSKDGILLNKAGDEIIFCPPGKDLRGYTIPPEIRSIADHAFISCRFLTRISIPASVASVGDEAFPRGDCLLDITVDPGAGSERVGAEVFDIFRADTPLVFPRIPVTFIREARTRTLLSLGFCMHPEKYDDIYAGIYRDYVKTHVKTITKKAEAMNLSVMTEYLFSVSDAGPAENQKMDAVYTKLSPKAKVLLLENAVIENDVEKVRTLFDICGEFEFTARALGLACLYAGPEMVRTLVDRGLSFAYTYDPGVHNKYGAAYHSCFSTYPAEYSTLIARTGVNEYNRKIYAYIHEYHFGKLPPVDRPENEEGVRADIAEYLLHSEKARFDASAALFYALLWGSTAVAERLIRAGVVPRRRELDALGSKTDTIIRNEWVNTMRVLPPQKCLYALKNLSAFMNGNGSKLVLSRRLFEERTGQPSSVFHAEILEFLFTETGFPDIRKSVVLEQIIDSNDPGALAVFISHAGISIPMRNQAIQYAAEHRRTDALAWLMDYKNRTADVAAEEAREERKRLRELMEKPDYVSALRKKWRYKKQADGTIIITGYKGKEETITVPSRIGRAAVTVIGDLAFSPYQYVRGSWPMDRERIKSVSIPEGVEVIQDKAFYGCRSLRTVSLPSTLKSIGRWAFESTKVKKALRTR